jgi:hypothetical protein
VHHAGVAAGQALGQQFRHWSSLVAPRSSMLAFDGAISL